MLRATALRKLVKPRSGPEILINLQGTEIGAPVSIGATVNVTRGQVTATGTGYDFVDGLLEVITAHNCGVPNYTTFTISGSGPLPELNLVSTTVAARSVFGVRSDVLYAAYRHPGSMSGVAPHWVLQLLPVSNAPGSPYELIVVIADSYVRVWLNGVSIGRGDLYADYLGPPGQWRLDVGTYFGGTTYTGHIDSIRWEVGALYTDVDNI